MSRVWEGLLFFKILLVVFKARQNGKANRIFGGHAFWWVSFGILLCTASDSEWLKASEGEISAYIKGLEYEAPSITTTTTSHVR